jgi:hypothetical protein
MDRVVDTVMELFVLEPDIRTILGTEVTNVAINSLAKLCRLLKEATVFPDNPIPLKQELLVDCWQGEKAFRGLMLEQFTHNTGDPEQVDSDHVVFCPTADEHTTEAGELPPLLPNACRVSSGEPLVQLVHCVAAELPDDKLVVVITVKLASPMEILAASNCEKKLFQPPHLVDRSSTLVPFTCASP